jgi:hypothetical protein
MQTYLRCPAVVLLVILQGFGAAGANAADPDPLLENRDAAYAMLRSGDVMGGAMKLLEGLRNLPKDDLSVADRAIEPFHLLLFTIEYLMTPENQKYFVEDVLDFEIDDIDELITCYFWATLNNGLDSEEWQLVRERLIGLSYRENPAVRAGALFFQSSPYFYHDSKAAFLARDKLNQQFPDLEITKVALRLPVLHRRHDYAKALGAWNHEGEYEAVKTKMADDPVLQLLVPRLNELSSADDEAKLAAGTSLLAQVRTATDWQTRYSVLLMVEPLIERGLGEELREICRGWSQRAQVTPDVVLAHIALINLARKEQNTAEIADWGVRLAALDHTGNPLQRILYEDIMNSALQAGDALVELRAYAEAKRVYDALARKFPNSQLVTVCRKRIEAAEAAAAPSP